MNKTTNKMKKLSKNEFENLLQNLIKQTQLILPTLEDKQMMLPQRPLLSRCISPTLTLAVTYAKDVEYDVTNKLFCIQLQTKSNDWYYKSPDAEFVFDSDNEIYCSYYNRELDDLYNYYLNKCDEND